MQNEKRDEWYRCEYTFVRRYFLKRKNSLKKIKTNILMCTSRSNLPFLWKPLNRAISQYIRVLWHWWMDANEVFLPPKPSTEWWWLEPMRLQRRIQLAIRTLRLRFQSAGMWIRYQDCHREELQRIYPSHLVAPILIQHCEALGRKCPELKRSDCLLISNNLIILIKAI